MGVVFNTMQANGVYMEKIEMLSLNLDPGSKKETPKRGQGQITGLPLFRGSTELIHTTTNGINHLTLLDLLANR